MRSGSHRLCALAGAALFGLGLAACDFGRNVADGCWIDQKAYADAVSYRDGLRQRNLAKSEGAWSLAQERITRTRKDLRACLDGSPGSGRPAPEHGEAAASEAAHGA